jgi:hypothetical protein
MATFLGTVRNPIRILTRGIYKRGGEALWLYRTIQRKLRQRGVLSTARYALVVFLHLLLELRPSRFRTRAIERTAGRADDAAPSAIIWAFRRAARRASDASFDRPYGVDTGSDIFPTTMPDSESDNRIYDAGYAPSGPDLFEEVFRALDIDPHYYTFIDYGSGKGRVLLLASRLPFRRVVGVEYSPMLHRIAEQNLHLVGFADRRSGPVESVCMDAVSFPIPEEPVILYFFNPFGRPIMERVRNNVVRSYERHPRCIVVIYLNPVHSDVWDAVEFLRKHLWSTVEGRAYVIYKVGY